jgi:hypothetical protein
VLEAVHAADGHPPGERGRQGDEDDRCQARSGEEAGFGCAPDARGQGLEADGRQQERGRELLHGREEHEAGTGSEAGREEWEVDGAEAASSTRAERSTGVIEPPGEPADGDLRSTHGLRAEVDQVGEDEERVALVQATDDRCAEDPEHQGERDHQPGEREAPDDQGVHHTADPRAVPNRQVGERKHDDRCDECRDNGHGDRVDDRIDELSGSPRASEAGAVTARGPVGERRHRCDQRDQHHDEHGEERGYAQPAKAGLVRLSSGTDGLDREAPTGEHPLHRNDHERDHGQQQAQRHRRRPIEEPRCLDAQGERIEAHHRHRAELAHAVEEREQRAGSDRPGRLREHDRPEHLGRRSPE